MVCQVIQYLGRVSQHDALRQKDNNKGQGARQYNVQFMRLMMTNEAKYFSVSDIDECREANVCGSNSLCNNYPGNYTCTCQDGYAGDPYTGVCTLQIIL